MDAIDRIPTRIKQYLLDYMNFNTEDYKSQFGTTDIKVLTMSQLKEMFFHACRKDITKMI
jgi:hypothetical protein